MKDKLVKNHHKGIYYRTRRAVVATLLFFSLGTFVGVPTYISAKQTTASEPNEVAEVVEEIGDTNVVF